MGCGKSKAGENKDEQAATAPEEVVKTDEPSGPKVIVVFGATGAQGGSVVKALKGDEQFVVKAATRNPDSDKAKQLADQGVEVLKVDMDDIDSVRQALQGAYGAFVVTNYWELFDKDKETQQGKNVVDAAKECGIQHLVFSGAKSAKEAIDKEVAPLESKAAVCQYITEQEVPFTVVVLAPYYENLLGMSKPKKNENHEYVLELPMGDKPLDMICVSEVGECIHQVFARPDEFKGQTLALGSQRLTVEEYAAILSKAFDTKKFVASNITVEEFAKLDFHGAEDLALMYESIQSGKFDFDIELTRRLNPAIPNFEQWVDTNKDAFDAALD